MTIAGTGHRPNKLGGYSQEAFDDLKIIARMYLESEKIISKVISGMAIGWDQALAQAAIDANIPLVAAIPFQGQESVWNDSSKEYYQYLLENSSEIVYVSSGEFSNEKMQIRNRWMVNNCDLLVAMWNGDTSGGTYNCIQYAKSQKRRIINLYSGYNGIKH